MNHNPLPYRSGATKPPPTIEALLFYIALDLMRLRLELYHPRETTRWN